MEGHKSFNMASIIEEIAITCKSAPEVTNNSDGTVDVRLFWPDKYEIFDMIDIDEFIDHFGKERIFGQIDKWEVKEHYNLAEQEDLTNRENEIEELQKEIAALKEGENKKDYINFEEK